MTSSITKKTATAATTLDKRKYLLCIISSLLSDLPWVGCTNSVTTELTCPVELLTLVTTPPPPHCRVHDGVIYQKRCSIIQKYSFINYVFGLIFVISFLYQNCFKIQNENYCFYTVSITVFPWVVISEPVVISVDREFTVAYGNSVVVMCS